ncbi:MAG: ATP-dependent zinc protease family protein [Gammaproteobacteria bacterium]
MIRNILLGFFVLSACLIPLHEGVAKNGSNKITAGWVENIILATGQVRLRAKLDTGAKTSSIHAENIERYEVDGEPWVRFSLPKSFLKKATHQPTIETPVVRTVLIKRHNLESMRRLVVKLAFCINAHYYETEFTLANRSNYLYPVLLGRSFLADNIVVDPSVKHKKSKIIKKLECTPELSTVQNDD